MTLKKRLGIFCAFLLLTGAAFQYGGLRLDLLATSSSSSAITLTSTSKQVQVITGSAAQVAKLPDATTLSKGFFYAFVNESSGTLTISNSSSVALTTLAQNESAFLWVKSNSTTGGPWTVQKAAASSSGSANYTTPTTITGDTTLLTSHGDIWCNSTSTITVTLYAANTSSFHPHGFKNINTGACVITRASSDTIDGDTSITLYTQYETVELRPNGSTLWSIF